MALMHCFLAGFLIFAYLVISQEATGELKTWHKVTLDYEGPEASESSSPNPLQRHPRPHAKMGNPSGKPK